MEPIKALLLGLKITSELAPILLPQLIVIAKRVKGLSAADTMTIDEFDTSIRDTQSRAKKWDAPIV